jgi:hemerythrin
MSFKWKDRYNLNINEIDKQHRRLFEIGARAYDLAMLDDSFDHYDEIIAIFNELLDYTEYHFTYEEKLMETYKYEGHDRQKQEHAFFIGKIREMTSKDIDSDQKKAVLEVMDFLSEWISSHILFSDRKYAVFFEEKGISI